jgi:hypothetical protein
MADDSRTLALDEHEDHETELLDVPLVSPALSRLVDEVRSEEVDLSRSYNRTYNRHNR